MDLPSLHYPMLYYFKPKEKTHHGYSTSALEQIISLKCFLRLLSRSSSPDKHRFHGDAIFHVFHCLEIVLGRVEFDHLFDGKLSSFIPLYQIRDILSKNERISHRSVTVDSRGTS